MDIIMIINLFLYNYRLLVSEIKKIKIMKIIKLFNIWIININTILVVPMPYAFIHIPLSNGFSFKAKKLYIYAKTKFKSFNINKIIALLLSSFVILWIRYIFNYYNYVINISLFFIIFCGFLKPIFFVIIEYMDETDVFRSKKKILYKYFFFNNTFLSYNNLNNIINNNIVDYISAKVSFYNTHLYDIHIPITIEKFKSANNLYEVDEFFRLVYEQEKNRHQNKLKELICEAVLTGKIKKSLVSKIEEEYLIFKERLNIIEEDRCTHVVYLRVKKNLKY